MHSPPLSGAAWDIKTEAPFLAGSASSLRILVGWDTSDYTNTGSNNGSLNPLLTSTTNPGAALPVSVNALTGAASRCMSGSDCPGIAVFTNRFWIVANVTPLQFPSGRPVANGAAGMEGHPGCTSAFPECPPPGLVNGVLTQASIPVKSEVRAFSFSNGQPVTRRQVVDIAKCQKCHNGGTRDGVVIPRLALHGANRNEEPALCAVCHNPNQTDIPYRTAGAETPVDFKYMVHAIHGAKMRSTPYIVIGRNGSVNDYSHVKFPAELKNCLNCHIEVNGKGTFELPLSAPVLGTTVNTGSIPAPAGSLRTVDVDPHNDLKITPTAATCSACHNDRETISHMTRNGASFSIRQQDISPTRERCATCHGPGRSRDVRKEHGLGGRRGD